MNEKDILRLKIQSLISTPLLKVDDLVDFIIDYKNAPDKTFGLIREEVVANLNQKVIALDNDKNIILNQINNIK